MENVEDVGTSICSQGFPLLFLVSITYLVPSIVFFQFTFITRKRSPYDLKAQAINVIPDKSLKSVYLPPLRCGSGENLIPEKRHLWGGVHF